VQFLVDVLVLAALYAILAVGFVLIYRASHVFNFAQGDLMMVGGYFFFFLLQGSGGQVAVAVPLALLGGFVLGVAVYLLGIRPLAGHPPLAAILLTVAIGILLRSLATIAWSAQPRHPVSIMQFPNTPIRLPQGAVITTVDVALLVFVALFFLGLLVVFQRTSLGIRMRAVAERPQLAAYSGVSIHRILALSWGLAAVAATIGALFYSTRVNIQPEVWVVGLKALVPALVGGLNSPSGVLPGALLVALVEVLAGQYLDPILVNVAPFVVLLVAVWIRPWGLFGAPEEVVRV